MNPLFSVIVPTYNRAAIISATIESVLAQTFQGFELIIVDDGSSDNTVTLIHSFRSNRIKIISQRNKGVSAARNLGASLAKGEYLVFLDSDDEFKKQYLEEVNQHVAGHPDIVFVGADFVMNGTTMKTALPSHPYGKVSDDGFFLAGTFVVRKKLFDLARGYDIQLKFGENTELSLRLKKHVKSKVFINNSLLVINQSINRSSTSPENFINSLTYTLRKHEQHYNVDLENKRLYLQILGVSYLRVKDYKNARNCLWNAYKINPIKLKTLVRLILSMLPILSRQLYSIKKDQREK